MKENDKSSIALGKGGWRKGLLNQWTCLTLDEYSNQPSLGRRVEAREIEMRMSDVT